MRSSHDCFANFVLDFRTTFVRVSPECCENFLVLRTSREMVAKVLNMFKNFMQIFSPKYFARLSCDGRASVTYLSPRNFGEFTMRNFRDTRTNVVRVSHYGRATVLRKPCDYLARNKIKRHSYECRTTLAQMLRDCRANLNENKLHSRKSRKTLSRMSRNCHATVARQS